MQGKKKWAFHLIFLCLVMGATIFGLFRGKDLETILHLMQGASWGYWLLSIGLVVAFICGESLVLHDILHTLGTPHQPSHCFLYSFIGFFFSCITPSAGGGQPAQVYFMNKDRIDMAVSVPVMMLVTITYKLVLVLYALVIALFRPRGIMAALEPVLEWWYLGIFLNVAFVSVYFLLIFRPGIVEAVLRLCLRGLGKFLSKAKLCGLSDRLTDWMGRYGAVGDCFGSHGGMLLRVLGLTILQRSLLFAVTFFAIRSFGITGGNLWTVMALQAMISIGTDILPLPGGMGASETMFLRIFPAICGTHLTLPVLLVSRGISYYGQLLISAVFTGVGALVIGKKKGKEI